VADAVHVAVNGVETVAEVELETVVRNGNRRRKNSAMQKLAVLSLLLACLVSFARAMDFGQHTLEYSHREIVGPAIVYYATDDGVLVEHARITIRDLSHAANMGWTGDDNHLVGKDVQRKVFASVDKITASKPVVVRRAKAGLYLSQQMDVAWDVTGDNVRCRGQRIYTNLLRVNFADTPVDSTGEIAGGWRGLWLAASGILDPTIEFLQPSNRWGFERELNIPNIAGATWPGWCYQFAYNENGGNCLLLRVPETNLIADNFVDMDHSWGTFDFWALVGGTVLGRAYQDTANDIFYATDFLNKNMMQWSTGCFMETSGGVYGGTTEIIHRALMDRIVMDATAVMNYNGGGTAGDNVWWVGCSRYYRSKTDNILWYVDHDSASTVGTYSGNQYVNVPAGIDWEFGWPLRRNGYYVGNIYTAQPSLVTAQAQPVVYERDTATYDNRGVSAVLYEPTHGDFGYTAGDKLEWEYIMRFMPHQSQIGTSEVNEMIRDMLIRGASDTAIYGEITAGTSTEAGAIAFRSISADGVAGATIGESTAWNVVMYASDLIEPNYVWVNETPVPTCPEGVPTDIPCFLCWEYDDPNHSVRDGVQILGEFEVGDGIAWGATGTPTATPTATPTSTLTNTPTVTPTRTAWLVFKVE